MSVGKYLYHQPVFSNFLGAVLILILNFSVGTLARAETWFQEAPKYNGLATASDGSLYAGGTFTGTTVTIGNVTLNNYDVTGKTEDAVIVKYNEIGNVLWARQLGSAGADSLIDITTDTSGNAHVVGTATGAWINPQSTALGTSDTVVAKVDAQGNLVWSKRFGGPGAAMTAKAITTDAAGNVYVSGTFTGADVSSPAMTRRGMVDIFLIKLDAAGNVVRSRNFGGGGTTMAIWGLAADRGGNVYLTASFTGNTPSFPVVSASAGVSFVMKVDATGDFEWSRTPDPRAQFRQAPRQIGVDGNDRIYVAGGAYDTLTSQSNLLLWGLTASGDTTFSKIHQGNIGNSFVDVARISVERDATIYVGGYLSTVIMSKTGFVAKFNSTGEPEVWQDYWGRNSGMTERSFTTVLGLASDSKGSFYFSADSGGWMVRPMLPGNGSAYLAKYPTSAAAETPAKLPQTGWWYNPDQTGRGIAIEYYRSTNKIFMGVFGYDASGNGNWQVGVCAYDLATSSCTGNLDIYRDGPTLNEVSHAPATFTGGAGSFTLNFTDGRNGSVSWANEQFPITRFRPDTTDGTDTSGNAVIYTGWYWDPKVAGRGYFLETWQNADGTVPLYGVGFMYRSDGSPAWYVLNNVSRAANPTSWQLPFVEFSGGSPSFAGGTWQKPTGIHQAGEFPFSVKYTGVSALFWLPSYTYIWLQHFVQ